MAHEEFRPTDLKGALDHVVEECGEVLAAAGKTLRFGFLSVNPLIPKEQRETNAAWLDREAADLMLALATLRTRMHESGLIPAAPQEKPEAAPTVVAPLTKDEYVLLMMIESGHDAVPGGTGYAYVADLLSHRGIIEVYRAERSPNGRRWYRTTELGRTAIDAYAKGIRVAS